MKIEYELDHPVAVPREEVKAHAHSERNRIRRELAEAVKMLDSGIEADLVDEPGVGWKVEKRHGYQPETIEDRRQKRRHWKQKAWKRRTMNRKRRAAAWQEARKSA